MTCTLIIDPVQSCSMTAHSASLVTNFFATCSYSVLASLCVRVMACTCCLVCVMVEYLLSYVCHIIFIIIVNLSPSLTGGVDNFGKVNVINYHVSVLPG